MNINRNFPDNWKADISESVDFYNKWFLEFAPKTFRETRIQTTKDVKDALIRTNNLLDFNAETLKTNPGILSVLRMSTCPPIARDRLIGLSYSSKSLVNSLERGSLPPQMLNTKLETELDKICIILKKLIDPDIFIWYDKKNVPNDVEIERASTIIADRLCGSVSDPIVRNAQEKRQLLAIRSWLESRNYRKLESSEVRSFKDFPNGTFDFHFNVPVRISDSKNVNIPIDIVIKPFNSSKEDFPVLIEAKSAGDFTNVNKRRKEEAQKMTQLKTTYGGNIPFILFLCGYFDTGYLGYEAAEGIDWVWEHRIDDLIKIGL